MAENEAGKMNKKARKGTYTVRRETAQALKTQIRHLESELVVLKMRSLPREEAAKVDSVLQQAQVKNAKLANVAQSLHLNIAEAQAQMGERQGDIHTHPLYTCIRLPEGNEERRRVLDSKWEDQLRNAYQFFMFPSRVADPKQSQSDKQFETSDGNLYCVRYENIHFPGAKSLQQVWDALVFYVTNLEISISEKLGHITVRDDYDCVDGKVYNTRILSTINSGLTIEGNVVTFSHLYRKGEAGLEIEGTLEDCGVLSVQSVHEDKLYPYVPSERIRRDTAGAIVLTVEKQKVKQTDGAQNDDELVVIMRRAAFLKLYYPDFPVTEAAWQELQGGIARWGDVMLKTMRDILYKSP